MNAVQMTARLYDMRDYAKRVLGDRYAGWCAEMGKLLEADAKDAGSVLASATRLCKRADLHGVDLILVMGAACELIEPSTDERSAAPTPPVGATKPNVPDPAPALMEGMK